MRVRLGEGTHVDVAIIHVLQDDIEVRHLAAKYGARSIRMIARNDALEFAVFVAFNVLDTVRRPFFFDQVDKLRWIPMNVRINHRLGVVSSGLLSRCVG